METQTLIEEQATVVELDPKKVKKGWRAREDYGNVSKLAQSIKDDGQMQPIMVRISKKTGAPIIIAGMRRLRACRSLGIKVKAIVVEPRNEVHALSLQLGENIKRKQFDMLEIGEGLKRLKLIYEKEHPETKHGAIGKGRTKATLAPKFVDLACKMLELQKSRVYELIGFATLPAETKQEIATAKTTAERNLAAQRAVKKVRQQTKQEKLKKEAAKKKKAREEAEEAGAPEEKGCTATLYHGDGFKGTKPLMPQMTKGSIDLILTDPPYELKRSAVAHASRQSINASEEIEWDWDKLDVGWFIHAAPLVKVGGSAVIFCPFEAVMDYRLVFAKCGWKFKSMIVWHKTNPGTAHRSTYLSACEAIVWGVKGTKPYTFEAWDNAGAPEVHNFREGAICGGKERLDHPAQKPLWLVEDMLLRHSNTDDTVLDPFCGVATTLVACKTYDRYSVGIEKSGDYIKQAKLRLGAL